MLIDFGVLTDEKERNEMKEVKRKIDKTKTNIIFLYSRSKSSVFDNRSVFAIQTDEYARFVSCICGSEK